MRLAKRIVFLFVLRGICLGANTVAPSPGHLTLLLLNVFNILIRNKTYPYPARRCCYKRFGRESVKISFT